MAVRYERHEGRGLGKVKKEAAALESEGLPLPGRRWAVGSAGKSARESGRPPGGTKHTNWSGVPPGRGGEEVGNGKREGEFGGPRPYWVENIMGHAGGPRPLADGEVGNAREHTPDGSNHP